MQDSARTPDAALIDTLVAEYVGLYAQLLLQRRPEPEEMVARLLALRGTMVQVAADRGERCWQHLARQVRATCAGLLGDGFPTQ
ncbi:hypothetical protein [Methylobacterium sp. ID0610]|uniref:hypothetical protein n=1 Tax=Methylobacterium carpenticola TaxID=3344827 RepID=UPI0036C9262A